ncbi:MAG: leucyl aminopeptidase family protein [Saprospiraceae bacterium]|nr:leucyl aminopeptidase family protein [Saprospiraceae bacterium]
MQFKFRAKPTTTDQLTIIPFDQQYCDEQTSSHLKDGYGIVFNPKEGIKNSYEVFKTINGNRIDQRVIINLTDKFNHSAILQSILDFAVSQKTLLQSKIQIELKWVDAELVIPALVQAFELSTYNLALYKTQEKEIHPLSDPKAEITFITEAIVAKGVKNDVLQTQVITQYQKEVMDLVNAPYNKLSTVNIVDWVKNQSKKTNLKVAVYNKVKMLKTGLHAVLAVNRGSESEPAFIIAEYTGNKKKDAGTIGLVGKGVTFDTGGLSIKPSNNMHYMKSDMGGAATVLGAIAAIAALKWPVNVVAITPITDNCVDASSIKPGDVIDSYSGKTIEIIDTDAEGRLILADALAYMAKNYEVDHIIDLATLTGSCVRTFGTACAGLFSNDDELADTLSNLGLQTGEKVWSLPIWEEYDEEMKSDIADIKNLSTKPMAGAITAAKFLQAFIADHPSWAHLDIAGVAFGDTKFGKSKAATGWGVHLLCQFAKEFGS